MHISFLFFSFDSYSQVKNCGSSYDFNSLPPSLQQSLNNLNFTPTSSFRTAAENQKSEAIIMIPVVVHVVHRNDEQNVSDAVIRNQIEILNNDFRLRNVDRLNTPSLFTPLAADTRIQFYLACRDPQGNPHSGIIRKRTTHTNSVSAAANRFIVENNTVAFDSESGSNSWDNTKYLNIYVADFYAITNNIGDGILGVGHFPHDTYTLNRATPNATRSNVVSILQVDYKAFGSGQSYMISGANFGRTATHEIGHWLELRHIWGDDNGACTGSDLVDDTPNQAKQTFGCETHPLRDDCSSAIMFMNYMDYTDDNCVNIFTKGQKNRMRNCLDPNASADVRRTLTYDKVYIESSSTVEFLSANEERTFTLMGAGSSATANWSVSPSLNIMSQTGTTLRVKAKDGFDRGWVQVSVNNFGICSNISIPDFRYDFSIRPTIVVGLCTSNQDFRGVKDKITCDEISGWALNVSNFSQNVGVKISVDWGSQVTAETNLQRTYPGASPTAPLSVHGFAYLPSANASWKDGTNHTIRLTDVCENIVFATQILNCPSPSITTNISSWTPSANAETQSVTVTTNASWTASSDATNWLTIANVTGQGFTMNANLNSGGQRLGVVTITSGSSIKRINVTQAGSGGTPTCTITSPKPVGTWAGLEIELHQMGPYKVLVTKQLENGITKYFARGKDFWFSVSRYPNTDYMYDCINVSTSAYGGLSTPAEINFIPAGYALGYQPDGARYFTTGNPNDPCNLATAKVVGDQNGIPVELRQFEGWKLLVTAQVENGITKYFPRGRNFWNWGGFTRYPNTDQYYNCINVDESCWWGLCSPAQLINTIPFGFSVGYQPDGARYIYANQFSRGRIGFDQSIEMAENQDISIFPNPTNGKIKLSFTLQKDENVWFNLYDAQGKNLQLSDFEGKKGRNEVEFDLQNYSSGAYFIDLQYNQKREVRKVMKVN